MSSLLREVEKASRKANLMGDAMMEHRQRSGELRDPERSEEKRVRAGAVNNSKIPNKGTLDDYGNLFSGLGRQKIADNAIGTDEADAQFLDLKHVPIVDGNRRLPGMKVAAGADLIGTLDVANLPANIPARNVPHLQELEGLLNIGGKNSQANIIGLPAGAINGSLPWSQVGTRKSRVPNFAKQNDLDALERRVRKLEQARKK